MNKLCPGAFASTSACLAACQAYPGATGHYALGGGTGNTFACHVDHLTGAAAGAPGQECPRAGPSSDVCQ